MNNDEILRALIEKTNDRLGYTPTTPSDFNRLIMEIKHATGENLSLSSIKRLWGYVAYKGSFSTTTLNILSRYNGEKDWISFKESLNDDSSDESLNDSGFLSEMVADASKFKIGDKLELFWEDDKYCLFECIGKSRFNVMKSENIKLLAGDEVTLHTLCTGHPLYVTDIVRGPIRLAAYVGAKNKGIATIKEIPAKKSK